VAKFRDLSQLNNDSDRTIGDRQRHRNFVKEQLKSNLALLLEELNIFKADAKESENIQKITLKLAKEYRFIYDEDKGGDDSGVGQSNKVKAGDVVGEANSSQNDNTGKLDYLGPFGGKDHAQLIIELTPEEIDDVLDQAAEDLNLPFLSSKFGKEQTAKESRWRGLKETGIEPRLDLEASYIERIKRAKMKQRQNKGTAKTGLTRFIGDDLRYHGLAVKARPQTNVLVVYIMDVSGSMDNTKRYFAKAFCYALYNFVRTRYTNAEKVFIAHDTKATEVDSDTFFKLSSDGGTTISSGPRKALKIIRERFDPEHWDIYCVHCSDGDNNVDDEYELTRAFKNLLAVSNLVGFLEIRPGTQNTSLTSQKLSEDIKNERFKTLFITKKEDVREKFYQLMSINNEGA